MGMKTIRATLTLGIASLAIQAGQACSACSVADEETRYAYYATTALLSFLPLFMIGGVVFYIAKKGREVFRILRRECSVRLGFGLMG
jgi:hypothetical protein